MNNRTRAIAYQAEAAYYAHQATISRDAEHAAQTDPAAWLSTSERASYAWQAVHCQMLAADSAAKARAILTA